MNTDSPKGYIVEKLLLAPSIRTRARQPVTGAAVRYVDWLFPGILGMNMMFSCLFGVGYVVLRYRKSGFLKRLHATPLTAFEFLSAQVLSRLALILFVTVILYVGIGAIIGFHNAGSVFAARAGGDPRRPVDDRARADHRRALLQRGTGRRTAQPAHLADDAAVGHLVLARGLAALGAVDRARLPAHPRARCRARGDARWRGPARRSHRNLLYLAATALAFLAFGAWSFRWRID